MLFIPQAPNIQLYCCTSSGKQSAPHPLVYRKNIRIPAASGSLSGHTSAHLSGYGRQRFLRKTNPTHNNPIYKSHGEEAHLCCRLVQHIDLHHRSRGKAAAVIRFVQTTIPGKETNESVMFPRQTRTAHTTARDHQPFHDEPSCTTPTIRIITKTAPTYNMLVVPNAKQDLLC